MAKGAESSGSPMNNKRPRYWHGKSSKKNKLQSEKATTASKNGSGKSSIFTVLDFDTQYPIFNRLTSLLDPRDLLRLSRTCKTIHKSVERLKRTRWNVNKRLGKFFSNPEQFRSLQAKYDMLISGSFATAFFAGDETFGFDMQIHLQKGAEAELLGYLADEGYHTEDDEGFFELSGLSPINFESLGCFRWTKSGCKAQNSDHKVAVVICKDSPLESYFKDHQHTAAMNIITWNKAYSLFPIATYVQHCTYALHSLDNHLGSCLNDWSRRGWKAQSNTLPGCPSKKIGLDCERRMADKYNWQINLDCTNIQPSATPDFVIDLASFQTDKRYDGGVHHTLRFVFHEKYKPNVLHSPVLKRAYGFCKTSEFRQWIETHLGQLTAIELYKIPEEQRPDLDEMDSLNELPEDFKRPASWQYFDDEIPQWVENFDRAKAKKRGKAFNSLWE